MGSDLGCCAQAIRIALILINIFFGILGVIVLAIGIWAIVVESDFSFITGSSIVSGAAILIVAGIITFIICVVGILGAIFKARPLLVVYALVVLVIVILEIVAGIVAFVFRDNLIEGLDTRVLDAIRDYTRNETSDDYDPDLVLAIDSIQSTFSCCGYNNASDWFNLNPNAVASARALPGCPNCTIDANDDDNSCGTIRDPVSGLVFQTYLEGCNDASNTAFTVFASVVGAIGIVFGILEIVGILFALFLCCCITSARKQEVV